MRDLMNEAALARFPGRAYYPKVLSEDDTLNAALAGESIARFGDGEFRLCLTGSAPSQDSHPDLQRELQALLTRPARALVCVPNVDADTPKFDKTWYKYVEPKYIKLLRLPFYGSAFITRPDSAPWIDRPDYWAKVAKLWEGRDVTLVVGDRKSLTEEMMIGARSVRVIEGPVRNAYSVIDSLETAIGTPSGIVLLCLGACATVLAARLAEKGVHAVDTGHIGMFMRNHQGVYSTPPQELVSDDYRAMLRAKHAEGHKTKGWGSSGEYWAPDVGKFYNDLRARSALDYGCGKGSLRNIMTAQGFKIDEYDPGIKGKDHLPKPADLVVCTDVLEHVEPDKLDTVLKHLYRLTGKGALLVISTREAREVLPDGRNAHLIVRNDAWWLAKIEETGWTIVRTDHRRGIAIWCMRS